MPKYQAALWRSSSTSPLAVFLATKAPRRRRPPSRPTDPYPTSPPKIRRESPTEEKSARHALRTKSRRSSRRLASSTMTATSREHVHKQGERTQPHGANEYKSPHQRHVPCKEQRCSRQASSVSLTCASPPPQLHQEPMTMTQRHPTNSRSQLRNDESESLWFCHAGCRPLRQRRCRGGCPHNACHKTESPRVRLREQASICFRTDNHRQQPGWGRHPKPGHDTPAARGSAFHAPGISACAMAPPRCMLG